MSHNTLLNTLSPAERAVAVPLLLCLVAARNLVLLVDHADDVHATQKLASHVLAHGLGMHSQRIRIRSSTSRRDFVRALFPTPVTSASASPLHRVRSRTAARKRSLPASPPATATPDLPRSSNGNGNGNSNAARAARRRVGSDASSFHRLGSVLDDDYDSTTSARGGPRPEWGDRGISTHFDGPFDRERDGWPSSPLSSASQLALDLAHPRVPGALVVAGLEHAGSATQHALSEIIRTRTVVIDDEPATPSSTATGGRIERLPDPFIVVYVCAKDAFERPPISKSLLDRFAFSAVVKKPPPGASSPYRSPPMRAAMSREDVFQLRHLAQQVHIRHALQLQLDAFLSAARHHPRLDGTLLTLQTARDFTSLVCAARVLMGPPTDDLDATDADAVRVFVGAIMHRLRVRAGPQDEIMGSYAFGALAVAREAEPFPVFDDAPRPDLISVLKEIVSAV